MLQRNSVETLTDSLDRSPSAVNLIAVTPEGEIIGGGRVAFPFDGSTPVDTPYFDFRPFLPDDGAKSASGSMLWVHREQRRSRLAAIIQRSVVALSASNGMSHLCVAAHPSLREFLVGEGWEVVADEFLHPVEMVPVVPLIIDLADRRVDVDFLLAGQTEIRVDEIAVLSGDVADR